MKIYLAGPFFNTESREVVRLITAELERQGHEVWSPMRDGIECPKDASSTMRGKVYRLDIEKIEWAECIVAVLDYPLPPYQELLLKTKTPEGKVDLINVNLPDVGTVFEIGYAVAKEIPCIGCVEKVSGFNLMLGEALVGIAVTLDELGKLLVLLERQDFTELELIRLTKQKELEEF